MLKKGHVLLILAMLVVGLGAVAHGAKTDAARKLLTTVYFQKDSAVAVPEYENELKKIRSALKADPTIGLQIEAYSYHHRTAGKNRQLAQKRAEAVQQWFVKQKIDADRLVIKNLGRNEQAIQKDNPEPPSQTERVEIVKIVLKLPAVYLPVFRYEFDPVLEGQEVTHDFVIQNKGDAPLKVQKVKTD